MTYNQYFKIKLGLGQMLTDVMGKPSYAERITRKKNQLRSDLLRSQELQKMC